MSQREVELRAIADYCVIGGKPELATTYMLVERSPQQVLAEFLKVSMREQCPIGKPVNNLIH